MTFAGRSWNHLLVCALVVSPGEGFGDAGLVFCIDGWWNRLVVTSCQLALCLSVGFLWEVFSYGGGVWDWC